MSTSVSRRSSAPVHPTRQQLEELDALLKRMLELPVNPLEEATEAEEAAPPTATARSEGPPAVTPPEPMRGPHRPALVQAAETAAAGVNYQAPDAEEADLNPPSLPRWRSVAEPFRPRRRNRRPKTLRPRATGYRSPRPGGRRPGPGSP